MAMEKYGIEKNEQTYRVVEASSDEIIADELTLEQAVKLRDEEGAGKALIKPN